MEESAVKQSSNPPPNQSASPVDSPTTAPGSQTIALTAYVDVLVTLVGIHPIIISEGALILPRAHIDASQGSIHIGAGATVCEKAVIGGRLDAASLKTRNKETRIGIDTRIEPFAQLASGVSIGEATIIDSHVVLEEDVQVGSHSKVCHNVTLARGTVVGDWEVVMATVPSADGELGHTTVTQKRDDSDTGQAAEKYRMRALKGEREGLLEAMKRSKAVEDQRKRQSARLPGKKG